MSEQSQGQRTWPGGNHPQLTHATRSSTRPKVTLSFLKDLSKKQLITLKENGAISAIFNFAHISKGDHQPHHRGSLRKCVAKFWKTDKAGFKRELWLLDASMNWECRINHKHVTLSSFDSSQSILWQDTL